VSVGTHSITVLQDSADDLETPVNTGPERDPTLTARSPTTKVATDSLHVNVTVILSSVDGLVGLKEIETVGF